MSLSLRQAAVLYLPASQTEQSRHAVSDVGLQLAVIKVFVGQVVQLRQRVSLETVQAEA